MQYYTKAHLFILFYSIQYPAASAAQSMKGKTPLHIAAREGHVDFVEMLLRLNPSTAQISTKKLKLPLHFAAGEGLADVCKQLLRVFPQGATQRSTKGKLPLHLAR
jgi:ankyrin repeat protein